MAGRTLVTGAGGFIGSSVVRRLLERGRQVRCYLKPGEPTKNLEGLDVEIVVGDVNDRAAIARAIEGCDVLYHLAAIYSFWMPDRSLIYEVNVEGSKTVLWAAYKAHAAGRLRKVVYTSSIVAIGHRQDGEPADETVPFGERDTGPTPTGLILLNIIKGRALGWIKGGFCAIDVDDLAEGHVLAEEKGRVGERYILGNHNITFKAFGELAAEV